MITAFFLPTENAAILPGTLGSMADGETQPLQGMSVLLLEDNLIVALEAEDLLRAMGAASILAVSSVAAAAKICETTLIDFAVLDIQLGFENSLGFADSLRDRKTPFVFASGYGDQKPQGESRLAEVTVSKPYDRESLCRAITLTLLKN